MDAQLPSPLTGHPASGDSAEQIGFGIDGSGRREPRMSARRRAAIVGGGVGVLALGAGALSLTGIATAASPSPSPTAGISEDATGPGAMDGMGHGLKGGRHGGPEGPGGFGLGGAVHAQAVVRAADGTFTTVDTQVGTVSAVSASSISVKSADGFTKTYTVTAETLVNSARDGIASVKVGTEVDVFATEASGTATAKHIVDRSTQDRLRQQWPGRPGKPGGPHGPHGLGATASPAPTS